MADPVRTSASLVARLIDLGIARINELARLGSTAILAALLSRLERPDQGSLPAGHADVGDGNDAQLLGLSPEDVISRGLLAGDGRFTRQEAADSAGIAVDEARRLWRALGFPKVEDGERVFTVADVAALKDAAGLVATDIVDSDALVEFVRPLGNLMSRLAAAQTTFISEVVGTHIAAGFDPDDPNLSQRLSDHAVATTQELLPVLQRATLYAWRRHLAAEIGRALIFSGAGIHGENRLAAVGFIDITGYTRLSRNLELPELGSLLDAFETTVLNSVVEFHGRVIKNLGDEILFVVDDPVSAAEAALQLQEEFSTDKSLPPIHAGLAFGSVLFRGGDVYGPVVNIAARLAGLARKGTVRVDHAMAQKLRDTDQFTLAARAPRRVRGYPQLSSYRLQRAKKLPGRKPAAHRA